MLPLRPWTRALALNIHVHPTGDRPIRRALDIAQPGDILDLHPGVYPEAISTYDGLIALNLTIRAYRRGDVTLAPIGTDRVVTIASDIASGLRLIGLTLDASQVTIDGVKLTHQGTEPNVQDVTLADCEICGAPRQGILAAGTGHVFRRVRVRGCGGTDRLSHGIYITGDHCLVNQCDFSGCGGSGVHIYDGTGQRTAHHNLVRYSRCWDNAKGDYGSGIVLGGGDGNRAYRNACWRNRIGVQVWQDSVGAEVLDNYVGGNAAHPYNLDIPTTVWVMPGAQGTIERGNWG